MITACFQPADLFMDLCILLTVQLSFSGLHLRRLTSALSVLGICTIAMRALPEHPFLFPIHLIVMYCSSRIAIGAQVPHRILEAFACMMCSYAVTAGFAMLTGGKTLIPAIFGSFLLLVLMRRRMNIKFRWNIEISVEKDGLLESFTALIDTGNLLREPDGNLPVLIAEHTALPEIYRHVQKLPDNEMRTLPFGVLGGEGNIRCFRADQVRIMRSDDSYVTAPDCWIAVFPGKIPGRTCALAPPEFADVSELKPLIPKMIHNTARRFCYGVFKR